MGTKLCALNAKLEIAVWHHPGKIYIILENEKFFELKSKEYSDDIKRKETRWGWGMSHCT